MLCGPADCVRSGVGTATGLEGTRTGSVVVRAGGDGINADSLSAFGEAFRGTFRCPVFSSKVLLGGEEEYLKALGTIIFTEVARKSGN